LQSGLPETGTEPKRYSSLDAYRGFIMLILASEGFGFSALHGDPTWAALRAGLITYLGRVAFSGT